MAFLQFVIENRMCPECLGTGKAFDIEEKVSSIKTKDFIRPAPFDLDCCRRCNGFGKIPVLNTDMKTVL